MDNAHNDDQEFHGWNGTDQQPDVTLWADPERAQHADDGAFLGQDYSLVGNCDVTSPHVGYTETSGTSSGTILYHQNANQAGEGSHLTSFDSMYTIDQQTINFNSLITPPSTNYDQADDANEVVYHQSTPDQPSGMPVTTAYQIELTAVGEQMPEEAKVVGLLRKIVINMEDAADTDDIRMIADIKTDNLYQWAASAKDKKTLTNYIDATKWHFGQSSSPYTSGSKSYSRLNNQLYQEAAEAEARMTKYADLVDIPAVRAHHRSTGYKERPQKGKPQGIRKKQQ